MAEVALGSPGRFAPFDDLLTLTVRASDGDESHGPFLPRGGYEDEAQCDINLSLSPLLKHYHYLLGKGFYNWMHQWLSGRVSPSLHGQSLDGVPTPTGRLDLKHGEYVRIKAQTEIEQILDKNGKNRALWFDPQEMAPYCGRIVKILKSVTKIIDEPTGKMLYMKQPCIMLEGVVCKAEYASCQLNCLRGIPSYWRAIWLERVEDDQRPHDEPHLWQGVAVHSGVP